MPRLYDKLEKNMMIDTGELLRDSNFDPWSQGERLSDFDYENNEMDAEELARTLISRQDLYGGVGITASQLGIDARVFAFKENTGSELVDKVAFNPNILGYSEEVTLEMEGCLSYPGLFIKVKRPKSLQVEYWTEKGDRIETVLGEFTARVFAHEYDHCEGTDFRDRASQLHLRAGLKKRKFYLRKMKQHLKAEYNKAQREGK